MGRELTPAEVRELLAAYALDAVDAEERDEVERYLERSPDARAEVVELREVASLLAQPDQEAPVEIWERIEEALAVEPPELAVQPERRRPWRWNGRSLTTRLAFAGAVLGVVALGVTVVVLSQDMSHQEDRLSELAQRVEHRRARDEALAMAADPHARTTHLTAEGTDRSATVVTMPDGHGYVIGERLPALAPGRTYQLWAMADTSPTPRLVSAGVLGRDPTVSPFQGPVGATGFAVTDEVAPGVERSDGPPVVEGHFD